MPFIEPKSSIETYWRAIILIGRNVASYKFALAKSLLEMDTNNKSLIRLDDLALPFAKNICEHLITADKQITSSRSTFLGYCRKYNTNEIDENKGDRILDAVLHYMEANELDSDFRFDIGKVILGKGKPKISIQKEALSIH